MLKVIVELTEEELAELATLIADAPSVNWGTVAEEQAREKLLKALEEAIKNA